MSNYSSLLQTKFEENSPTLSTDIMLGCIILGEENAFPVDFDTNKTIGHLKGAIKEQAGLVEPAHKLILWRVNIPENEKYEIHEGINIKEMFRGEKLVSDLKTIGQVFKIPPPSEHIHIIVELPATTDVKLSYTPRLGGIGGTMILATEGERVGTYEGINLNSPDICHREQTIQKLVEKISKVGFLLVRSPPMSGKTSLGQLLEQHLVKDPNIRVIRISLLWMGIPSGTWTFEEEFERLMSITWKKFQDECGHIRTIFIVDEVQMLYVPQGEHETASRHKGNVFWETVKRCQQISNLSIVAFAAYDYKGAWDLSSATYTIDVSPFMILPENTWSIEDVRFTEEEYKDYFLRFCSTHLKNMEDEDDINYLQEYVCNTTACYPGLVAFFMNHIRDHFSRQLKYDDTLKFDSIFLYLKSHGFMKAGFRGFAHIKNLTPEEEELCDRVFQGPINIRQSYSTSGKVKMLVRTNLLSEQDGKLDFASPYLRVLYLQRRWGSTIRPIIPPQDFKSFLHGTFTNMNAEAIRNSYCVGTDGRLLERAWQMEFYRAATQVLPADIFISPDVGTYWGSSGYMDFFVGDSRSWAIELLRDGEKASDHKSRINKIYKPIGKISKEWAIIDIRHPGLPNNNPEYSADHHWINIYCQEGWKSVIIEDKDEKVEVKLMGEYL
ncbi:hypothetical protein RhiirA1_462635 [Rhizophagus irregularis]|uniref:Crinkler effector protein N-terminal domain-containing protein n=1 Tax=Rhizophagus irregularis TaxID=588596 RepID=A0A2N0RLV7_9GLOM|nr:hypothetical protein RhiirA1_462635 [Rhizophagus irregularis]